MKKTIGILAHVDAGKTTFSEELLYVNGSVRSLGRENDGTSHLDTNEVERDRGITVFADQASFKYNDNTYYFIDTPGHIDFSPETERIICALDYAVLLVSGTSGVQAHTAALFKLLGAYNVPVFFFINKCDMENADVNAAIRQIKAKLTPNALYIEDISKPSVKEELADLSDDFAMLYLEDKADDSEVISTVSRLTKNRQCFPVISGSALSGESVKEFVRLFDMLTFTAYDENSPFSGVVYKIRYIDGKIVTFIKALSGRIQVRDEFSFNSDEGVIKEKITEIRFYNGDKYTAANEAEAGDIFAVTGISLVHCGGKIYKDRVNNIFLPIYLTTSALEAGVEIKDETDTHKVLECFKIFEQEEPSLCVRYSEEANEILINTMGKIQLEIIERIFAERFNIAIAFKKPNIKYRETIRAAVMGYGHFEPLRHYAEVALRLEPLPGKGGKVEFVCECDKERLDEHWHRLIKKHIFERPLPGILTGSPITNIRVVLTDGRSHLKHTSPGDFRQATHRAVRQGLEKAENVLLEPFYSFEIQTPVGFAGKIMADIQKMRGSFNSPIQSGEEVTLTGSCPVETFMDYPMVLAGFTSGSASISLMFDRYDVCQEADRVIAEKAYNKGADKANPSSSVFTSHGTSFVVEWYECEAYMHTLKN